MTVPIPNAHSLAQKETIPGAHNLSQLRICPFVSKTSLIAAFRRKYSPRLTMMSPYVAFQIQQMTIRDVRSCVTTKTNRGVGNLVQTVLSRAVRMISKISWILSEQNQAPTARRLSESLQTQRKQILHAQTTSKKARNLGGESPIPTRQTLTVKRTAMTR
jgi:hypothetical protein